ncbi:hypothetical protein [Clostridium sp.]|nr:hypothetical protein [Clostridium sp.]
MSILIVCFIASLSALEEMVINIIAKKVNLDIKGLYNGFNE